MEAFTGAKFAGKQIEVLVENRIPFIVNAQRKPVTTWEAINRSLGADKKKHTDPTGFNLEAARL